MPQPIDIAVEALREIIRDQGQVCIHFEFCKHASCRSSYTSWAIADKALKEISEVIGAGQA